MMNHKEIDSLKSTLTKLTMQGSNLKSSTHGIDGKIAGVGFKPYSTNRIDSIIEKLEFNCIDGRGRIMPFFLHNVVGYEVISHDGEKLDDSKNVSFDIHVFSPQKVRDKEPYDKIRLDIAKE